MKVITEPQCCDNRALALATKEELIADIVLRQGIISNIKKNRRWLGLLEIYKQKNWIKTLTEELQSRYVIDV